MARIDEPELLGLAGKAEEQIGVSRAMGDAHRWGTAR